MGDLPLKVAVLTTKTPHHLYFLREIRKRLAGIITLDLVLVEERPVPFRKLFLRYLRNHWYNPVKGILLNPYMNIPYKPKEQHAFEMERFFSSAEYGYDEGILVENVWSVNGKRSTDLLNQVSPDVIMVYGTGLVNSNIFEIAKLTSINFHGGWLPDYRGSDTNLWAALKGDYDKIAVACHKLDKTFDTGPVFMMERLLPVADLSVPTIRYYTTLLVIDMAEKLLRSISNGTVEAVNQPAKGDFFRFMPWILKPWANRGLRNYARNYVRR